MDRVPSSMPPLAAKILAGVIVLTALLYLGTKVLDPQVASVDMKYLWLAGVLWTEGTSPYGAEYLSRAQEIFVDTNVPNAMLYPPYWYPWARLFGSLPVEQAQSVWGYMSGMMILAGSALMAMTFWSLRTDGSAWWILAFVVFLLGCMGTAQSIAMGQTAPILLLGVALFLYGQARSSRTAICAALVLLMLKPHVGLPFAAFALLHRHAWPAVLWAAAISIVAALPAILPYGLSDVVRAYLETLRAHDANPVFAPPMLTGYANLSHHLFGWDSTGFGPVVVATLAAGSAAVWLRRADQGLQPDAHLALTASLALLAGVVFIVPLHTYDLLLVAPVILAPLIGAVANRGMATILGLCVLVLFRPNNLAEAIGVALPQENYATGSALASVALLVLWLLSLAFVLHAARARTLRQP